MSSSNLQNFQNDINRYLDRYHKFQKKNQSGSFVSYLESQGMTPDNLFSRWENELNGTQYGAGQSSFSNHFVMDGNKLMLQGSDGTVVSVDTVSGETNVTDQAGVAGLYGVSSGAYDSVNIGQNTLDIHEYTFTGYQDGTNNSIEDPSKHYRYDEIIMSSDAGKNLVSQAINNYVAAHGSLNDLRKVFGYEEGQAANVLYGASNKDVAVVVQGGKAYKIKYDSVNGVAINELTAADTNISAAQRSNINSLTFSIGTDNQLHYDVTYKNGGTGPSSGTTTAWGDPHFQYNGVQAFDFQGPSNGTYNMLKANDVSLTATFGSYSGNMRIISGQALTVNISAGTLSVETDVTDTTKPAKVTVKLNGQIVQPGDYSKYGISTTGNSVTVNDNGRSLNQNFNITNDPSDPTKKIGYINNYVSGFKAGDIGLLTQAQGAYNEGQGIKPADQGQYMVYNGGGFGAVNYIQGNNPSSISDATKAILRDLSSNSDKPVAARFTGSGYSRNQWDEFVGCLMYAVTADVNGDGILDKAVDLDGDGFTDGFDLGQKDTNGNVAYNGLQDNEKVLFNFRNASSGLVAIG